MTINEIRKFRLKTPEAFDQIQKEVESIIFYSEVREAKELAGFLEKELNFDLNATNLSFLDQKYLKLIIQLKYVALPLLTDLEIKELLEKGLVEILGVDDFNLIERFKTKLVIFPPDYRNEIKRNLRQVLLRNNQLITSQELVEGDKKIRPTVANWLKSYDQELGAAPTEDVKRAEYFTKNSAIRNLNKTERKLIKELFDFYEFLKSSSLTEEGLEESIVYVDNKGQTKILEGGHIYSLESFTKPLTSEVRREIKPIIPRPVIPKEEESLIESSVLSPTEQEVLAAYQGDPRQVKAITKEEQKLDKKFKGNAAKIRAEFFKAVQKKNINQTIAILRLLAQKNELENFIKEDAKLNKFLATIWEKQYGKELAAEFKENPAQVKFVRLFLRYVLEQRLEMSSSDAARVGLQMGNIFVSLGQKGYNKMAFFDIKSKEFRWFE